MLSHHLRVVTDAWNAAHPDKISPLREFVSEDAYWASGREQAAAIATALEPGCSVLDFGCGDGRISVALDAMGFEVLCADSSAAMLGRLAERLPDARTIRSDGTTALGVSADAAICVSVLIHHHYGDQQVMLANLRDAVRPGGLLILDWPVSATPKQGRNYTDVTTWDRDEQDRVAADLGLERECALTTDDGPLFSVFRVVAA